MLRQKYPHIVLAFLACILKASCQKSTVAFVVDTTGSMGDDINQVKNQTEDILDLVFRKKADQIENMVLVTFNDPDWFLNVDTKQRYIMNWNLRSLMYRPDSGGDCPEMSLSGIQMALEHSLPGSYIYVFTDASAKDHDLSSQIQELSQRKQSQVVFVLTGDCGNPNSVRYRVYHDIAIASSGLVIRVDKSEVTAVLTTIEETLIGNNKTVLTAIETPANTDSHVPFTIDDHTNYAIVSAYGRDVNMTVTGPSLKDRELLTTNHGKITKLLDPVPGRYNVHVRGSIPTIVIVVGQTDIYFSHGFSVSPAKTLEDTTLQPDSYVKTYLSVLVTDPGRSIKILSAQILDMNEKPITNMLPLKEMDNNYYVTPFEVPPHMFKVAIHGKVIATQEPFQRNSKTPVSPKIIELKPAKILKETETAYEGMKGDIVLRIPCKVVGKPKPTITWKVGNTYLSAGHKYMIEDEALVIRSLETSDTNRYTCEAKNKGGSDTRTVEVRVTEGLVNFGIQHDVRIRKGDSKQINCMLPRSRATVFRWFFNGRELDIHTRQINLKHADFEDGGKYTCHVSDANGSSTETFVVDVGTAPRFTDPRDDQLTNWDGETNLLLDCSAEAKPDPNIEWKFNGRTESHKEFQRNVYEWGKYTCRVSNIHGAVEKKFEVLEKAKILPDLATVYEGIKGDIGLRIPCNVVGKPKPTITWKVGESILSAGDKYRIKDGGLVITKLETSDSNRYTCEAKNKAGSDIRKMEARVTEGLVNYGTRRDVHIRKGDSKQLTCPVQRTLGTAFRWFVNGREVDIHTQHINVENADFKDGGKYTCHISDASGSSTETFVVDVGTPPRFTDPRDNQIINWDGETNLTIDCNAVAKPVPNIEWKFKGRTEGHKEFQRNVHEWGEYTCRVSNIYGVIEKKVEVLEQAKILPELATVYEGIKGDIGLRIPCNVVGKPKPTVTWKVGESPLSAGAKFKIEDGALVITKLETSDSNSYTCEAKNKAGSDVRTMEARVTEGLVDYGTRRDVHIRKGDSKQLTCPVQRTLGTAFRWFVNGRELDSHTRQIYVENADFKDGGKYTCHVSDANGSSTETFVVDVGTAPRFTGPRDDQLINWDGEKNITIDCNAEAKPYPSIEWKFNGRTEPHKEFQRNVHVWGEYTCRVSNIYGVVEKKFGVKISGCMIRRNYEAAEKIPLILNENSLWPALQSSGDYLIINAGDKLLFSCPNQGKISNHFQRFPSLNKVEATCVNGDTFKVRGESNHFSDMHCANEFYPEVKKTDEKCGKLSKLVKVGYDSNSFVETYQVCLHANSKIPLYTRVNVSPKRFNLSSAVGWQKYPEISNGNSEAAYNCKTSTSSCCYSKSQLVSAQEFSYVAPQNSTFLEPLNAIPSWQPCDANRISWERLNDLVRSQTEVVPNLRVSSGTHTLQEVNGALIPRYLWKVIPLNGREPLVVVYVNGPSPTEDDIRCPDECSNGELPWLRPKDQYTYCCSTEDFLEFFNLPRDAVSSCSPPYGTRILQPMDLYRMFEENNCFDHTVDALFLSCYASCACNLVEIPCHLTGTQQCGHCYLAVDRDEAPTSVVSNRQ